MAWIRPRKRALIVTSYARINRNVNDALLGMTVAILLCAAALFVGMCFGR